ncbi:CoA transferase [Xanthobacter sp. KR7-225]|uniref:CoA transferase n=1 Tax=Xanthobacter sp. KR7-225 TaxID=3156613 RepID=UPI0032B5D41C
MYGILNGMRVVEAASFVAGPSCGLHLLQLGAEVIRIDPLEGGADARRWPLASNGASLYWEGLNKGKKSVALNLKTPEGRELAQAIVAAPGADGGLFVTNQPVEGLFSHAALSRRRTDLITVRVMGWADGRAAVDYTVNCAVGVPDLTGPVEGGPVNHVLPAWDLLTGAYAAFALVAAERQRSRTGAGLEIHAPLGDMAMATLGHLGQVAEVALSGRDRERTGNVLYGAFGRDFETADGHRVMVVALTSRQWTALVAALHLGEPMAALEQEVGLSFAADEGARYRWHSRLSALMEPTIRALTRAELSARFEAAGVLFGPYRTLATALAEDPGFLPAGGLFEEVTHPGGGRYPTPGPAVRIPEARRGAAPRAPRLGEHTAEVLAGLLGLSGREIDRLNRHGIAGAAASAPGGVPSPA